MLYCCAELPTKPTGDDLHHAAAQKLAEIARKYKGHPVVRRNLRRTQPLYQHVSIARFIRKAPLSAVEFPNGAAPEDGGWACSFSRFLRWLLDAATIVASETFFTSTSAPIQYAAVEAFQPNPIIDQYLHDARRILRVILLTLHRN